MLNHTMKFSSILLVLLTTSSSSAFNSWMEARAARQNMPPLDPRTGGVPTGGQQGHRMLRRPGSYQGDSGEPVMPFDPKAQINRPMDYQFKKRSPGEVQDWNRPFDQDPRASFQKQPQRSHDPFMPRTNEPVNWRNLQQEIRRPGDPKDAVLIPDRHSAQMLEVENNRRPGRPDSIPGRAHEQVRQRSYEQRQQQQVFERVQQQRQQFEQFQQQQQQPFQQPFPEMPPPGPMIAIQETNDISHKLNMLQREKDSLKNQVDTIQFQLASADDERQVQQLEQELERLRNHMQAMEQENLQLQESAQGLSHELVMSNAPGDISQDLNHMLDKMSDLEQENLRLRHSIEELQHAVGNSNNFHEMQHNLRDMLREDLRMQLNRLSSDVYEPEIIEDHREFTNLPNDWGGRYRRKKHPISTETNQNLMKKGGMENSELQDQWKDVHTMPAPYFGRPIVDPFKTRQKRKIGKFQAVTGPGAFGNDDWHQVSDRWSGMSKRHGPHYSYRNDGGH